MPIFGHLLTLPVALVHVPQLKMPGLRLRGPAEIDVEAEPVDHAVLAMVSDSKRLTRAVHRHRPQKEVGGRKTVDPKVARIASRAVRASRIL